MKQPVGGVSRASGLFSVAKHKPSIRCSRHNYSYIQWQRSLHMYRTLSILTQTQTKEHLWREKEFVRSWDWATYIESVFKKVEEKDFQKLLNTMKEPQPIMFEVVPRRFSASKIASIRYILHSDYIDLNLEHVLSRAIGTYKHFKDASASSKK